MDLYFGRVRESPERSVVALFLVFCVCNLWNTAYPPLHDLPGHAARYSIYANELRLPGSNPYHRVESSLVPNLGGDLVVVPLLSVVSVRTACKVFLLLASFLFWFGPAVYLGVISEDRAASARAALCLLPFAWCTAFAWGFLHWYSGIGLTFLVLAHRHVLAGRRETRLSVLLFHSACVCLLFVWHLSAWVMYVLVAGLAAAVEMVSGYRRAGSLRAAIAWQAPSVAAMLPSFVLILLYKLQSQGDFAVDPRAGYRWGTIAEKAKAFVSWYFLSYDHRLDAVVVGLVLLAILAWFRFDFRTRPRFSPKLVPVLMGTALFIVMPRGLGNTEGADVRVIPFVVVGLLALAAERPIRGGRLGFVFLVCALGVRQFEIQQAWTRIGSRLDDYSLAFQRFSPGTRVFPVILLPGWEPEKADRIFHDWAAAERGAFIPDLWVMPGQYWLRNREFPCGVAEPLGARPWGRRVFREGESVDLSENRAIACYDFLWVLNRAKAKVAPPPGFEVVERRGDLTLWERQPDSSDQGRDSGVLPTARLGVGRVH